MDSTEISDEDVRGFSLVLMIILIGIALGAGIFFMIKARDDGILPPQNIPSNNGSTATTTDTTMVRVVTPHSNDLIKSPVTISGQARGNWYFEASFPVKVLDANGKILGQAPAQAQGEWMTTEFVSFLLNLNFATSTTATGTVILEKDNPSGLPENAAEVRIPVRFRP